MYTAMKPKYNRKTKGYDVEIINDAPAHLIHHGYFVFDNPITAAGMIRNGQCLSLWAEVKRTAILNALDNMK